MPKSGRGAQRGHRENVAVRQVQALALRRQGATYVQIGERTGTSNAQACRDVAAALNEVIAQRQESASALLALELERLDWLVLTMTPHAQRGNTRAAMVILRTSERRSKLLGLDAPQRMELAGKAGGPLVELPALSGLSNDRLFERLDQLRAQLTGVPAPMSPEISSTMVDKDRAPSLADAYAAELARRANGNGTSGVE